MPPQTITQPVLDVTDQDAAPELSIVIPLYNAEESSPKLYEKLTTVLTDYDRSYGIIIVDLPDVV